MKVYLKYLCLSLLLAIFIVSLGIGQKSNAQSWENFVELCQEIVNGNIPSNSNQKTLAQYLLNNKNNVENAVNVNNYTNFTLSQTTNRYLDMFNGEVTASENNNQIRLAGNTTPKVSWYISSNSLTSKSTTGNLYITSFQVNPSNVVGLISGTDNTTNAIMNKKYTYILAYEFPNYTAELPIRIADSYYGNIYTNITYELQTENNVNVPFTYTIVTSDVTNGKQDQIIINSIEGQNGGSYHLKMIYDNYYIVSNDVIISWKENQIIPPRNNNKSKWRYNTDKLI